LKDIEVQASLDFSRVSLGLIGVFDRLVTDSQSKEIPLGLEEPLRFSISGGQLTYEGLVLPIGSHKVKAQGTLDLILRQCRVAIEMPLDILHQRVLGLTDDFPRAGLSSLSVPVEFSGAVGSERLQVDVGSLLNIREFLGPLLRRDD
jgi:hypothetical protein